MGYMNKYQIITLIVGAMALLIVIFTTPKYAGGYVFVSHLQGLVFHPHITLRGGALMALGIITATLLITYLLKDNKDE
jgi:hypothetical protein